MMKRSLHVLALTLLTTSLALVGCGDGENKGGNGDGGTPTLDSGPSKDGGPTVDVAPALDAGKPDVPMGIDTPSIDVRTPIDVPIMLDTARVDAPTPVDTGAIDGHPAIDATRAVDTGAGIDGSGNASPDARQGADARRAA